MIALVGQIGKSGSSGVAVDATTYRQGRAPRTEPTVALQVERQSLKRPSYVPQSIAAPLKDFQLGIESFDKAAGLMVDEVVRNQIQPAREQREEWLEAAQAALCDPPAPQAHAS